MKNFNKKIIVSLCIALLVSMFTFIGISASSESGDPEVVALNVAYGDRIQLVVAVDPADNDVADIERGVFCRKAHARMRRQPVRIYHE